MRKITYRPYLVLGCLLASLLSMGANVSRPLRHAAISAVAPFWKWGSHPESSLSSPEDLLIRSQMEGMREWLLFEDRLALQVKEMQEVLPKKDLGPFFALRAQELIELFEKNVSALFAEVVFREPASWSSSLWVGVGEKNNERLKKLVIGKNSPVVIGRSLIGIVEEVGWSKSRVRLLTDRQLSPSVRSVRGKPHDTFLCEHLEALLLGMEGREDLKPFLDEHRPLFQTLASYLQRDRDPLYLAKGSVHGSSLPLWRSRGQTLKGEGFNYDFPDSFSPLQRREGVPILKQGDLLITTGLDGVFPRGLHVGIVSKVAPLKEGSSSYDIEAQLTAGSLEDLTHVFILPPIDSPL